MSLDNTSSPLLSSPAFNEFISLNSPRSPWLSRRSAPAHDGQVIEKNLSTFGAVYATLNIFVGLGLLSKPYATSEGGFFSFVGVALACLFANYSAKLIVQGFIQMRKQYSLTETSYPKLGEIVLGEVGKYGVIVLVMLEFGGNAIMTLIFLWKNIEFLLKGWIEVSIFHIALIATALVIPSVWYLKFEKLWVLSLSGVCAAILITITLFAITIDLFTRSCSSIESDLAIWCPQSQVHESFEEFLKPSNGFSGMAMSLGIHIISFAGHAALPSIYSEMKDPSQFDFAMDISFAVMFILYAIVSLFGYLSYGKDVHVLVSQDVSDWPGSIVSTILTLFIILSLFSAISPVITVFSELPEAILKWDDESSNIKKRAFRTISIVIFAVLGYFLVGSLNILEASIGSVCTIMTSFVLPLLFHLLLFPQVSTVEKMTKAILLVLSVVSLVMLTTEDFEDAVHKASK